MNEKTFPVPLCSTVEGMQWLYNTATDNFIRGLRDANAELAALRAEVERLKKALGYITDISEANADRAIVEMKRIAHEALDSAPADEEGRDA